MLHTLKIVHYTFKHCFKIKPVTLNPCMYAYSMLLG